MKPDDDVLSMWVVLKMPKDYPAHYVARRWEIDVDGSKATQDILRGDTLDEVRALLPQGLFRIDRDHSDDSVIVESWV